MEPWMGNRAWIMHPWVDAAMEALWRGAVGVVPLALMVAVICHYLPRRPGARHGLWAVVLLALFLLPLVPALKRVARINTSAAEQAPAERVPENGAPNSEPAARPLRSEWAGADPRRDRLPDASGADGRDALPAVAAGFAAETVAEATVSAARGEGREDHQGMQVQGPEPFGIDIIERSFANILRVTAERGQDRAAEDGGGIPVAGVTAGKDSKAGTNAGTQKPASASALRRFWVNQRTTWGMWFNRLAEVRDALGRVSPIPASLWVAGAMLKALVHAVSAWRLSRRIRAAAPAPAEVEQLAARAGRRLGLARCPTCVMVADRLSPLIWCGWRRRLVLPKGLWAELDEAGRRAVVTHELAHLHRRDHWLRWVDLAIGCVYWWHPVVWWVRSRVQAAAEECCDAWVTWLMPRERRAYAGALLAARRFVSKEPGTAPVVGIGAGTHRTKSFARRLTMIMTRRDAPGMPISAWVLAVAVAAAGWVAVPAHSRAGEAAPDAVEVSAGGAPQVIQATDAVYTIVPADASAEAPSLERRLERLEKQMAELAEALRARAPQGFGGPGMMKPHADVAPAVPVAPAAPPRVRQPAPPDSGAVFSRAYKLPSGRLEALTQLMVRSDVPVVVSPGKDQITVNGTAAQHAVFARFIELIGDEERQSHAIDGGRLEALADLMLRSDVPVRVAPGDDHIDVIGTPVEQEIFADFVRLITGAPIASAPDWAAGYYAGVGAYQALAQAYGCGDSNRVPAARAKALAEQSAAAQAWSDQLKKNAQAVKDWEQVQDQEWALKLMTIKETADQIRQQHAAILREAQRMREEAQRVREEAERMRDDAERLRERLSDIEARRPDDHVAAGQIKLQLAELERQVDYLYAQSDDYEERGAALSVTLAALTDTMARLDEEQAAAPSTPRPLPPAGNVR